MDSLKKTIPDRKLTPVAVKGFKRIFNVNNEYFLDSYTNNFNKLSQTEYEVEKTKRKEYYYKKYFTNLI